jgi:dephospho-CoA kinase
VVLDNSANLESLLRQIDKVLLQNSTLLEIK